MNLIKLLLSPIILMPFNIDDNDGQENTNFEEEKAKEKDYNPGDRSIRGNEKETIPQGDEIIDNERKRGSDVRVFLCLTKLNPPAPPI